MFRIFFTLLLFFLSSIVSATESNGLLSRFEYEENKMGVPVQITIWAPDESRALHGAERVYALFDRLNAMMTDYDPESELIQCCRRSEATGESIPVSRELAELLIRARSFTVKTDGAFDITVSPLVKLWRRSRSFKKLPPADYLKRAQSLIGNDGWEISADHKVRLLKKGVRFDLGGIAKGFALDEGYRILCEEGLSIVLLNAGGDLRIGAAPPGQSGWRIGFASLDRTGAAERYLSLTHCGVATSGDTFRFVEIEGVRYSHLIDPRSGVPMTQHRVVSVIAPDSTTADALASAFSILEPSRSLELARSFERTELLLFLQREERQGNPSGYELFQTPFFEDPIHLSGSKSLEIERQKRPAQGAQSRDEFRP